MTLTLDYLKSLPFYFDHMKKIGFLLERSGKSRMEASSFVTRELISLLVGGLIGLFFVTQGVSPILIIVFAGIGLIWPRMKLNQVIRRRQRSIALSLPYYLDLLTLALEAGLDLVAALEEIISRDKSHPLKDELLHTLNSIRLGSSRSEAFTELARRTGSDSLSLFAAAVNQSEELGSSLGEIFRLQAEGLRRQIYKEAEEIAQKAPLKMLLPLVVFIFPVTFLLLVAPVLMRLLM